MDLEQLRFRARVLRRIREFFWDRDYLELDTPALSKTLIPETCLEVFKTEYVIPDGSGAKPLYLVPSPEIYIKRLLARRPVSVFQLSKCYRNVESCGRIHSPEFTMLEYYTMGATYRESAALTEALIASLLPDVPEHGEDPFACLRPPFTRLSMDEAFYRYAGFYLSDSPDAVQLAERAAALGLYPQEPEALFLWPWDDLYELLFVQCVEPCLPQNKPVFLFDYPAQVPCLAKDVPPAAGGEPLWKERWELYINGIETANCYSEETDPHKIKAYFDRESAEKAAHARVPHAVDKDYWKQFASFPACSGTALGADRLIAALAGCKTIEPYLPFPLEL